MSIKCLMNGTEVNYPCSPACALFGDCVTAFESEKKANVHTNADRIRSMTDEELVNMVPCPLGFSMFRCPIERQCGPCKREWLKQPVTEGTI